MLFNETVGLSHTTNNTVLNKDSSELCLPSWILNAANVQSVYISDTVIMIVSIPFAIFAVVANLAVIVTIIRTPSLQRPVNVLLCSLAAVDCLTGLAVQPVFVAWRFLLHRTKDPCKLVHLYQASRSLNNPTKMFKFLPRLNCEACRCQKAMESSSKSRV